MRNLIVTVSALAAMASASVLGQDSQPVDILQDWSYDGLYASGTSIDQMLDNARVLGPTGDDIGSVKNIIFSDSGKALAIIAQVGGFWDIGDTHVSIPWDEVVIGSDGSTVTVPVTEENAGDYPIYGDNGWFSEQTYFARDAAEIQVVNEDLAAGSGVFRATELIGDYAYLKENAPYGYVNDLIIEDGQVTAIVVEATTLYNRPNYYAYPYSMGITWSPYNRRYQMPYDQTVVKQVKAFDYDLLTNSIK